MKKIILSLICFSAATPLFADDTNLFASESARVSYAIGMMTGHQWKQQDLGFDPDVYVRGIKDAMAGGAMLLTPDQAQQTIDAFKKDFTVRQTAKNKAAGEAFLAANKSKPGVVSLADGLQYLVLTNGTGAHPVSGDIVTVNYRGTLIDGTEFDSSYKRGQPATFPVNGVISGWTEALQLMSVGAKWKLFIPAELAYGERGTRGIPPHATLIFEVELLNVKAATPPPTAAPLTSDIIKVPSAEEMKKGVKIEVIKPEDAAKATSSAK